MLRIDSNLIWIIVNLLIFYFLIRKFLFKPVLNIIEKRKQMVTEQFEKADTVNAEALELKTQYEASLQGAKCAVQADCFRCGKTIRSFA